MLSDREIRRINQEMVDRDLADAYEEIDKLRHDKNSLSLENARLKSKITEQNKTIKDGEQAELENLGKIAELTKSNQYKDGLIKRLFKMELTSEDITYLLEQELLDKSIEEKFEQEEAEEVIIDSSNSSFPPSSDELRSLGRKGQKKAKRSNQYNSRKRSGRKRGAQKGHKGRTLTIEEVMKMVEEGVLEATYETIGKKTGSKRPVRRAVLELEIKPVVKIYEIYGEIPDELTKPVTYGAAIRALAVLLNLEGLIAVNRIVNIINGLSGNIFKVSEGSIYNFIKNFADEADREYREIIKSLLDGPVLCTDSTKFETRESRSYIRNHSNEESVCYIPTQTKTIAELEESRILPNFNGTLVHDHEVGMYHFGEADAECHSHNNRDLRRIVDETGHQWAQDLKDLFNSANRERKKLIAKGKGHFRPERIEKIESSVIEIVKRGWKEFEKETRNVDQNMEERVLKRFTNKKYRRAYLLFLHDFNVPFTNNLSERDLRKVVNKRKDIKKFGDFKGLERFCKSLSVSETLKRKGVPQFERFCEIIRRNAPKL